MSTSSCSGCMPNLLSRNRRQEADAKDPGLVGNSKSAVSTESASTVATEEDHSIKGGRLVGGAIKSILGQIDSHALGVKVVMGETRVDGMHGKISIDGLTIENPEGFSSEYLLKAKGVLVDLDMRTLITSFGKTLEVEKVVLTDVDVIYEKSWSSSNVDTVVQKLEKSKLKKASSKLKAPKAEKVIVHKVLLTHIGAKVCTTLGTFGPRLAVGDISYEDFDKQTGAHNVMDGISLVLETLLKSIVASVLGKDHCKSAWETLTHGKTRLRLAVSSFCEQVADLGNCTSCSSCQRGEEVVMEDHPGLSASQLA